MAAFVSGSPPCSSSSDAVATPSDAGSISAVRTVPSRSSCTVDGPVIVSSSSPSDPVTTMARAAPRAWSTPSTIGASPGSVTPIT
ncbi:MAG: hypothetical protein R2690_16795 [Acidimicrobiales bacterium]